MTRLVWLQLIALGLVVLGLVGLLHASGIDVTKLTPERVQRLVNTYGLWAPLAYLSLYGQPLVPLPASVMSMAGGLLFGPWAGTAAALTGATIRACGQFAIAKRLGRQTIEHMLKRWGWSGLDQRMGRDGLTAVLLVRLIPNVPYDLQNYGLGFSSVSFRTYAMGTVVGILPASFAYAYLGYSLTAWRRLGTLFGAVVLVVAVVVVQRWWTRRRVGG